MAKMRKTTEFISFWGDRDNGRLLFVIPSVEIGWSTEHVYMAVSWLFWQYSIAVEIKSKKINQRKYETLHFFTHYGVGNL